MKHSMGGKKIGQKQEELSRRRLVLNPTIQQLIINTQTKYDQSSLHGCGEISDKKLHSSKHGTWKYGKKENWTYTWKNEQDKAGSHFQDTIYRHQHAYQI